MLVPFIVKSYSFSGYGKIISARTDVVVMVNNNDQIHFSHFLLSGGLMSAISFSNGVEKGEGFARCPEEVVWGGHPLFVILQGGDQCGQGT